MRQIARFLVAATFTALAIAAWFDRGIGVTAHPLGYLVYVGTYTRQQSRGIYAYVVNELRFTVTVFAYSWKEGSLTELQTASTLPKDFAGTSTCAEIAVHPNGRFLYAANRGHDSIAVFVIDRRNGTIIVQEQAPTQGRIPRHFAIDQTGVWLLAANQGIQQRSGVPD